MINIILKHLHLFYSCRSSEFSLLVSESGVDTRRDDTFHFVKQAAGSIKSFALIVELDSGSCYVPTRNVEVVQG